LNDHEFVKTTLEAVGFRLPLASARFAQLGHPRNKYNPQAMPALHTLCRDIARKYRHRNVDVVVVSGVRSLTPAKLIAWYLKKMTDREVKVIQVVARRRQPTQPGRRGKLTITISGGTSCDITGRNVLLFEDVIRQESLLPHLGKETRYAGGGVVGIAGFIAYNGVRDAFRRRMSEAFLPIPAFGQQSPVLVEHRVARPAQLGRSNLWRHRARELGRMIRLSFRLTNRSVA
jgi:adenine/guanine phosphoribosyltransferase-like PRPP-binding protein